MNVYALRGASSIYDFTGIACQTALSAVSAQQTSASQLHSATLSRHALFMIFIPPYLKNHLQFILLTAAVSCTLSVYCYSSQQCVFAACCFLVHTRAAKWSSVWGNMHNV